MILRGLLIILSLMLFNCTNDKELVLFKPKDFNLKTDKYEYKSYEDKDKKILIKMLSEQNYKYKVIDGNIYVEKKFGEEDDWVMKMTRDVEAISKNTERKF